MRSVARSAAAVLLLLSAEIPAAQAAGKECIADHYRLVPVPLRPARINDSGQVAGTTDTLRAAVWSEKGGLTPAPLPPGFDRSEGIGINAAGHLIGLASAADSSKRRAFVFEGGKLTLLPGEPSKPNAINRSDEIAGEAAVAGKATTVPVVWKKGKVVELGVCCGGTAIAINDHGQVVGQFYDAQAVYHAFVWDSAHGVQNIVPGDDYSSAVAINAAGHVLVEALPRRLLLYRDGTLAPLELSPKFHGQARDFNNCDVIVGSFGPHSDALRAFVWEKTSGLHDLNERVPPGSGWKLEAATGINDRGEIVGWGDYKGKEQAGFLLVPQP
jgi:probable HAF family extracellular repeat protein